ncbi:hypothetical protein Dimus_037138 [Dionaea muscipula]
MSPFPCSSSIPSLKIRFLWLSCVSWRWGCIARALDVAVAERGGGGGRDFRLCGWRLDGSGVGRLDFGVWESIWVMVADVGAGAAEGGGWTEFDGVWGGRWTVLCSTYGHFLCILVMLSAFLT